MKRCMLGAVMCDNDESDEDTNEDDNLNSLKNGKHGEGVEALADHGHHIWVVNI